VRGRAGGGSARNLLDSKILHPALAARALGLIIILALLRGA